MPANTWMPVYTADLIASTVDMTPAQFGCYMRLLCYAWDQCGIPNDFDACCRIAGGMDAKDWNVIKRRFEVIEREDGESVLSHQRLEAERQKAQVLYQQRVEASKKAKERRQVTPGGTPTDVPTGLPTDVPGGIPTGLPPGHPTTTTTTTTSTDTRQDDSPSSTTQENLRATRKARRTYRIAWDADAGFSGITDSDRTAWSQAYPGVSLEGELAKAHVYLRENPAKAGKRNWGAFLARWFARVQDKGGSPQAPSKPPSGWSTKKYFRAKFQAHMTDAEYEAALRGLGARQTAAQPSGGVSTFADVIARYSASQEPQNGNYPD